MPAPIVFPEVPTPAEAVISPVGFSSTVRLIIFFPSSELSFTSAMTFLKKLVLCRLFTDLFFKISLKTSPSSNASWFLITLS